MSLIAWSRNWAAHSGWISSGDVPPVEFVIDRLIASDGRELFNTWYFSRNVGGLAQLLTFDNVYPGLADTGERPGRVIREFSRS